MAQGHSYLVKAPPHPSFLSTFSEFFWQVGVGGIWSEDDDNKVQAPSSRLVAFPKNSKLGSCLPVLKIHKWWRQPKKFQHIMHYAI